MSSFHDSIEWKKELISLSQKLTPGQDVPFEVFREFLEFFNEPTCTWKIPFASKAGDEDKKQEQELAEPSSITEQIVLQQTRHFLWASFYQQLLRLDYSKGEVFHIQVLPLQYAEFKDMEVSNDEFPPNTLLFEAMGEEDQKYIRIWSVILPNLPKYTFDDGESFTQYYEYAKLHIPSIEQQVHTEEDLFQIIIAERRRHEGKCYTTIAGRRDKEPFSVLYFYWATHFFFSAELFLEDVVPQMCFNPHLFPYPVQYVRAKNFRKFRYLLDEP